MWHIKVVDRQRSRASERDWNELPDTDTGGRGSILWIVRTRGVSGESQPVKTRPISPDDGLLRLLNWCLVGVQLAEKRDTREPR
jgi:hypothetical protein